MKHTQIWRKKAKHIYILMKTKQSSYSYRCRGSSFTKLSLSRPLLKSSMIRMTKTFTDKSPLWDHKFDALHVSPFTMKRPPYIGLERPNQLRYSWDRLNIFIHQLWILPKMHPWPQIWIQLTPKMRGISPWFSSTVEYSLKHAITPSKWCIECCNAPPKGGHGALALPVYEQGSTNLPKSYQDE